MLYEKLLREATHHGLDIYEEPMAPTIKGLYGDKVIWINKHISTTSERTCVLAEELGHYHTTIGDILDQSNITNRKQELRARKWAYEKLVPLTSLINAYKSGVQNKYELADHLGVTEAFLEKAIQHYKEKHGLYKIIGRYTIQFEPLGIFESYE